jgi:tyrosinase
MSDVRVRRDIWDLGDDDDPWRDPAVLAYAQAVGAMKRLSVQRPHFPTGWVNQAAIHERQGQSEPERLEDQCQHASWFFLPWHRMYLWRFEQIVRANLEASVAAEWALPYWNYSDNPDRRVLPPAFRERKLPDGVTQPDGTTDNPLFTAKRQVSPVDVNGGEPVPATAVRLTAAMRESVFSRNVAGATPGFGGGRTDPLFHHSATGPFGPLEGTPHGAIHNQVGGADGLMTRFRTAALDPIFWLHHSNIDRLWEQWLRGSPPHVNPTDGDWRKMEFELVDTELERVKLKVKEVLDIEGQLGYTYSGLPAPAHPPAPAELEEVAPVSDELPAEMVGANEEPVVLADAQAASSRVALSAPRRAADIGGEQPSTVYLNVEDVEGEDNPGLLYGVYLNLPPGETPDPDDSHFVGLLSFFGIESAPPGEGSEKDDEAPHRLRYVFDVTDTVADLTARDHWNPDELHVTFAPVGVDAERQPEQPPPPVRIGRVSLFVE